MDKALSGTLTEGKFGITDIILFDNNIEKEELFQYVASVEAHSVL